MSDTHSCDECGTEVNQDDLPDAYNGGAVLCTGCVEDIKASQGPERPPRRRRNT